MLSKKNGAKILSAMIRTLLSVGMIKVEPKINDGKWYDLKENSSSQISWFYGYIMLSNKIEQRFCLH